MVLLQLGGPTKSSMSYSTLTRKGQVTIPKSLRDQLGLNLGDRISFQLRGEEIVLKPVHRTILDLQGSVKPKSRPEDFNEVRRQVAAARGRARAKPDA
jgi:antitoxin PrlF